MKTVEHLSMYLEGKEQNKKKKSCYDGLRKVANLVLHSDTLPVTARARVGPGSC